MAFELEDAGTDPQKIKLAIGRARGSAKEGAGVRDYIARAGLKAFDGELRELAVIRQAHTLGRAASETNHRKINEEAQNMAREIADAMMAQQQETTP